MAEETVIEHKTVEEQKTVLICDECSVKEDKVEGIVTLGTHAGEKDLYSNTDPSITEDLCPKCIVSKYDLDVDPNRINDIEVDDSKLKIEETIEKKAIFPTISMNVTVGILIGSIFAPIFLQDSLMSDNPELSKEESTVTPHQAYVIGILGGLLWALTSFSLHLIL